MERVLSEMSGHAFAPCDFDWLAKNVPCRAGCPAGTDIPGYLAAIARGDYQQAHLINLRDNVFPGILGRVCTRPCEPPCRHGWRGLGESVAICYAKRAAADFRGGRKAALLPPIFGPTGKNVAVVGAGAAGLSAARDLALFGHSVTVFERHERPGGMMLQAIPRFRLPREEVQAEIGHIEALGVKIQCGVAVGSSPTVEELMSTYDAVVLAAGTLLPVLPAIPGIDLGGVEHGLRFLLDVNENGGRDAGNRVVVIGGGFTAIDCARTARMLGARHVAVYYRRSHAELSIMHEELDEMAEESIPLITFASPVACLGENGSVQSVRFVRTRLEGRVRGGKSKQHVAHVPGSEFEVPADRVLLATGQSADHSWLGQEILEKMEPCDRVSGATAGRGLFVAGDFVLGPSALIDAIGQARRVARTVDTWLMGRERVRDAVFIEWGREDARIRDLDYIPREAMPTAPVRSRRVEEEVEKGLPETAARREASRCYLCHYKYEIDMPRCIYCDQCYQVKPRPGCIVKLERLEYDASGRITGWTLHEPCLDDEKSFDYFINQEDCIRCDACLQVCPVRCIDVQKVSPAEMKEGWPP